MQNAIEKRPSKSTFIKLIIPVFVLTFCEWFFFRNVLFTDALFGDMGDGRLTALITEHWWRFFCGKERFDELLMFYPAKGVIGYSDLLFGYGLIHSLFRLFGINMYVSYKWTIIAVHMMGTASMYYLLRKKLKCDMAWSLFGTMAFSFSEAFSIGCCHTQLVTLSSMPLFVIFAIGFINNYHQRGKRNIYAYSFIVWFILLVYTSWYNACFVGLFCLAFIIVYCIVLKIKGVKLWTAIRTKIIPLWKESIGYLLVFILLLLPLFLIYYQAFKQDSGGSYLICVPFLPEVVDYVNVSGRNFLFGNVIEKSGIMMREGYTPELEVGFSVVLLALFITMCIMHIKHISKKGCLEEKNRKKTDAILLSVCISVVLCMILILRLNRDGLSLWKIPYKLLPFLRSIRAVSRFLLWLSFPIAVFTALSCNRYIMFSTERKRRVFSALAVLLIFISNIDKIGVIANFSTTQANALTEGIVKPPADAESFYLIDSGKSPDEPHIYELDQIDAFDIATACSIKTINGYSGIWPPGWNGMMDILYVDYEKNVFDWISKNDMKHVYAYDRAANKWIPVEERQKIIMSGG